MIRYGFEDKVVIVTGAGSGVGRAAAVRFAAEGAKVLVTDVDVDGGEQTVEEITAAGGTATFRRVDVADDGEVQAMVQAAVEEFGSLDVAVNNAGILGDFIPTADTPTEQFDAIVAVNQRGVFLGMRHQIPAMLERGGAIVNVSSAAGFQAQPYAVAYTGSKHAVNGMTRAAGVEYAAQGVRINAVNPGGIQTPMMARAMANMPAPAEDTPDLHPLGRAATAEEIASVILFLASADAADIVAACLPVDGGLTAKLG